MRNKNIRPLPEGLVIGLITMVAIGVNVHWTYQRALKALEGEVKEGLLRTVTATARMMDGRLADQHKAFHPVERVGPCNYPSQYKRLQDDKDFINWRAETMATKEYAEWKVRMENVRQATAHVRWLYTCVLIPKTVADPNSKIDADRVPSDHVYFAFNEAPQNDVADNITGDPKPDGLLDPAPNLLWPYPEAGTSQIRALKEGVACVDAVPYSDTWGTYYSGYAPFYDSDGKIVGTIGMDLETTGFNERMAPVIIASKRAAVTGLCVSILAGVVVWFVRRLCSQLWVRAGENDGGGRVSTALLQNAKSSYAGSLLETFRAGTNGNEQLLRLQRIAHSGRTIGADENANFRTTAIADLAREQADIFGWDIEVELDPEVPEILYGPTPRVSDAIVDVLEGLAGPGLQLRVSMADERIQWLVLVLHFARPKMNRIPGDDGEIDCVAENRVELASAQAQARAMRGELNAVRKDGKIEVTLRLPMRKSQHLEPQVS